LKLLRKPKKGQSKNILQIPKNISNRNVFSKITIEEFAKSKKLLQVLRKSLDPKIKNLQIHKHFFKLQFLYKSLMKTLSNLTKNYANPKKLIGSANNFLKNSKIVHNSRIVVKSRKNIFKIGKYVSSLAACASSQPALDVFPPFPVS